MHQERFKLHDHLVRSRVWHSNVFLFLYSPTACECPYPRKAQATAWLLCTNTDCFYRQTFFAANDMLFLPSFIELRDHLAIFKVIVKRRVFSVCQTLRI